MGMSPEGSLRNPQQQADWLRTQQWPQLGAPQHSHQDHHQQQQQQPPPMLRQRHQAPELHSTVGFEPQPALRSWNSSGGGISTPSRMINHG